MTYIKNLRVLNLARQNLREIMQLTKTEAGFGDLNN